VIGILKDRLGLNQIQKTSENAWVSGSAESHSLRLQPRHRLADPYLAIRVI